MPKALCITGLAVSAILFLIFLSDLAICGAVQKGQHDHGHRVRSLFRRIGFSELAHLEGTGITPAGLRGRRSRSLLLRLSINDAARDDPPIQDVDNKQPFHTERAKIVPKMRMASRRSKPLFRSFPSAA